MDQVSFKSLSLSNKQKNTTLNNFYNVPSASFIISQYSSMLPYRVIEALSVSNSHMKNFNARVSKTGWAWFVSGRQLFVWFYLEDRNFNRPKAFKCYELLLPSSDITYKTELICVFSSLREENKFSSVLAVSPEGLIRYWPNVSKEKNFFDSTVASDLQGQECQVLVDIQPLGCILGTTTNSLVRIYFNQNEQSQTPLTCRMLKIPQGIFSGLSKKVSSFIFGSLPTIHYSEQLRQLTRIIQSSENSEDDNNDFQSIPSRILVLSDCIIQKWSFIDLHNENFIGEIDLEKYFKEVFINKLWDRTTTHHNQISILPIDIAFNRSNELLLLVMCKNSDYPNENHLGLALVHLADEIFLTSNTENSLFQSNSMIKLFKLLPYISFDGSGFASNGNNSDSTALIPNQSHYFNIIPNYDSRMEQSCYIYNSFKLFRVNLSLNDDSFDEIDFQKANDYLLGVVPQNFHNLLLLTFKNGFLSVQSNILNFSSQKQKTSIGTESISKNKTDKFSVLKKALSFYLNGEKIRAKLIIDKEMCLFEQNIESDKSSSLDDAVCSLSAEICDQVSATDPRWDDFPDKLSTDLINSIIISNQLEDKISIHRNFVELMCQTGVWNALTSLTTSKTLLPSKLIVCEHAEKLIAAMAIQKFHSSFDKLLENTLQRVLQKRFDDIHKFIKLGLTYQDLFYQKVTKIEDFFWELIEIEENSLDSDQQNENTLQLIVSITEIFNSVLAEVCLYRQTNFSIYQSAVVAECDYVPWFSEKHVSGLRDLSLRQFDLLLKCIRFDQKSILSQEHCTFFGQKLTELADFILDSFVNQIKFLNEFNEKHLILKSSFESVRYKCITPLLRLEQYEKAAYLAEKYEDFNILIKICEDLGDQVKLEHYVQRFAEEGFSEHLCEWYVKEGKQGEMLSKISNNYKLTDFLNQHESLNWLHQIHLKQFEKSCQTLKRLSFLEEKNACKKKTLLSIAKLCLLASGESHSMNEINDEIQLLNYQFGLSESFLQKNNLDNKIMKVLSPEKLVDILISGIEAPNENLTNFLKALEIAQLLDKSHSKEIAKQMRINIWRKAFEKTDWSDYSLNKYEIPIQRSFFYQLYISDPENTKTLPDLHSMKENYFFIEQDKNAYLYLNATYEMIKNKKL